MNLQIDTAAMGALASSLAKAGLPALATIIGAVTPPPYDLLVKPAFSAVAWALGVQPDAPDAAQQVQGKIDANPQAAQQTLQAAEAVHKDAADEIEAYLKDVQDARATEVQLVQSGHSTAYAPAVLGVFNLATFAGIVAFFFTGHNIDSPNGNLIVGAVLGAYAQTQAFFMGSSQSARSWAAQAVNYAAKVSPMAKATVRR